MLALGRPAALLMYLFALAFVSALALAAGCASVPGPVRRELAKTPDDKVTVVQFVDFECPFCRRAHSAMGQAVGPDSARLRVVTKHVPLSFHKHADGCARVSICVERLGTPEQSRAVDEALYTVPLDGMDERGLLTIAERAGVSAADVQTCMRSKATDARIEDDVTDFEEVGGGGVPVMWIGRTRVDGAQPPGAYRDALDAALRR